MAKSELQLKARELRRQGISVRQIAINLSVAKSSVSGWVRDIELSEIQTVRLKNSEIKGRELGLFKTMQIKREKRIRHIETFNLAGISRLSSLTVNEIFVLGIGLYWAEGGKSAKNRRVEFCNSDPRMIKFLLVWLEKCFEVSKGNLRCVVGINQIHEFREEVVKKYWSDQAAIPLEQFRKTSFKRVTNNKVYENFENHYGTLTVLVAKSTDLYYQIMGLIKGLVQAEIRQGGSVG